MFRSDLAPEHPLTVWSFEKHGLHKRAELDASTSRIYRLAVDHLREYDETPALLEIVSQNMFAFEQAVRDAAHETKARDDFQVAWRVEVSINKTLLNFLASFRLYLDHTEARLKRRYGPDSPQLASFSKATSREYDTHFAYRFVYKLRNYAQHCGMPIRSVKFTESKIGAVMGYEFNTVHLNFDTRWLLSYGGRVWGKLESELGACDPKIEAMPLVKTAFESLDRVNDSLRDAEWPALSDSARTIADAVAAVAEAGMHPVVGTIYKEDNSNVVELFQPPGPLIKALGVDYFEPRDARLPHETS